MPTETRHHLHAKTVNGVMVVGLNAPESVFQTKDVEELDEELGRLIAESGRHNVLLNLEGIRYLSSSLLGRLINLHKKLAQDDRRFAVCCLTPVMGDTFRVSRLDHLLEVFDSEASALARL